MKNFLQPKSQIIFTTLFVLVQVIILIAWTIVYPIGPELQRDTKEEHMLSTCSFLVKPIIAVGFGYPILLIIVCTILAVWNRKVPAGFNETKYIGK